MRLLPSLLVTTLAIAGRLLAGPATDIPTVSATIPNKSITTTVGTPAIDLRNYFTVPGITGQVVQFNTSKGTFNVEMTTASTAQNTVANFLAYVNANRFTNSIVHRSDKSLGVIQGGGYLNNSSLSAVTSSNPIALETGDTLPNVRGAFAMARGTAPDTATSEWFVNTVDNSANLPPASAGGYAAFGRVTGTGMSVVDAVQALPVPAGTLTVISTTVSGNITVTKSAINTALVTVVSANLPAGFGPGWVLLGSNVTFVAGNYVTLAANANQTINTSTTVQTTNPTGVIVDTTTLPANFGPGWGLLGATVSSYLSGSNIVTLSYYPNQTITSSTSVSWTRLGTPFTQLPVLANLPADNSVALSNLVTVNSIAAVPVFPASATTPSVVTFTAASSNPALVAATVSGSNLFLAATANLTGSATITVTATDSNANFVQTTFSVSVTRKVLDFNADTKADILFQNSYGQIVAWNLNGAGAASGSAWICTSAIGDWKIAAIADMDNDGNPDLIFQNSYGQVVLWYLNSNGSVRSSGTIYPGAGLGDWKLRGTADLNRDGNTDLIFQNSYGQIFAWYMSYINGVSTVTGSTWICSTAIGDWKIVGVADMNGDGNPDLIFQNSYGQVVVWYLGSTGAVVSSGTIYAGNLGDWRIANTADLNGDGNADLVFQNTAGQVFVWFMNGKGTAIGSASIYSGGALGDWRLH